MHISTAAAQPVSWKNGGGVTRELALRERDGRMVWRISLADITRDGPFSAFPGLARIHCVVEGAGHILTSNANRLEARPLAPLHFDGALELDARLRDGPSKAFNVIYDPLRVKAEAEMLGGGQVPPADGEQVLFTVSGSLDMGQAGRFTAGEGLVTKTAATGQVSDGGCVIRVRFAPV